MRCSKIILLAGLSMLCLALQGEAIDSIFRAKPGASKVKEIKGKIVKDDFVGVTIYSGGGSIKTSVPRNEVRKVVYGSIDYRAFDAAMEAYKNGDYARALKRLEAAKREIRKLPEKQRPLFGQYISYYKAMCYFGMGEQADKLDTRRKHWKVARDRFTKLLAKVPDSAFYFDAMLNDARCLEVFSVSRTRERYKYLASAFNDKIKQHGRRLRWAKKYLFLVEMGIIRLGMEDMVRQRGKQSEVSRLLSQLKAKKNDPAWKKVDSATKSEATRIESMALTYLKKFEELAKILDSRIRHAQKVDDSASLGALYVQRGNAFFYLAGNAADAGKKKNLQERALLDYLRADLLFDLGKKDKGIANLRIGKIYAELKTPQDWKTRAKTHLKVARQCGNSKAREVENGIK